MAPLPSEAAADLGRLTPRQRLAWEAAAAGRPDAETANRFGISRAAVRQRRRRARQRLGLSAPRRRPAARVVRSAQLSQVDVF